MIAPRVSAIALLAAAFPVTVTAQPRTVGVCEALNSIGDHQPASIRGTLSMTRHGAFLVEGTGTEPCQGWPQRLFTAPSAIPLFNGSYSGVRVPDGQIQRTLDFFKRLRNFQNAERSPRPVATVSGVLIRKTWLLVFRYPDGTYHGGGVGPDGAYAALLVVTSAPNPEAKIGPDGR